MWYVYQLSMFYPPENLLALYITEDLNCEHSFIRSLVKNQIGRVFVVVAFENKNKTLFLFVDYPVADFCQGLLIISRILTTEQGIIHG